MLHARPRSCLAQRLCPLDLRSIRSCLNGVRGVIVSASAPQALTTLRTLGLNPSGPEDAVRGTHYADHLVRADCRTRGSAFAVLPTRSESPEHVRDARRRAEYAPQALRRCVARDSERHRRTDVGCGRSPCPVDAPAAPAPRSRGCSAVERADSWRCHQLLLGFRAASSRRRREPRRRLATPSVRATKTPISR